MGLKKRCNESNAHRNNIGHIAQTVQKLEKEVHLKKKCPNLCSHVMNIMVRFAKETKQCFAGNAYIGARVSLIFGAIIMFVHLAVCITTSLKPKSEQIYSTYLQCFFFFAIIEFSGTYWQIQLLLNGDFNKFVAS